MGTQLSLPDSNRVSEVLHPFDNLGADIILRTPDGAQFYAWKCILSLSSPIFESMFQIPQPAPVEQANARQQAGSAPVVDMQEDSRTLDMLLRLCYPGAGRKLESLEDAIRVLEAARKYEMTFAEETAQRRFKEIAAQRPTQAWAWATSAGFAEEARFAARASLRYPFLSAGKCYELQHAGAADFYDFIQYHRSCVDALFEWIFLWHPDHAQIVCESCATWNPKIPTWFSEMKETTQNILRKTPCAEAINSSDTLQTCLQVLPPCAECRKESFAKSRRMMDTLKAEVQRIIDTVPFGAQMMRE